MNYCNLAPENLLFAVEFDGKAEGYEQGLTQFTLQTRNISIDILKFLAVLLITNSHFDMMYAHFGRLATGGAFGDALFFFCSGFTLFLGRLGRFDNWYKRRISRIYPSVFGWAIVSSFFFCGTSSMKTTILHGGGVVYNRHNGLLRDSLLHQKFPIQ